jgi:hypothetical protein
VPHPASFETSNSRTLHRNRHGNSERHDANRYKDQTGVITMNAKALFWACHEGEQAAYFPNASCPYPLGTAKREAWLAGFHNRRASR